MYTAMAQKNKYKYKYIKYNNNEPGVCKEIEAKND